MPNCALIRLLPGQSVLGEVNSPTTPSNVPAHASLCVKKFEERLNIFFMVAGIEECSNSELGAGPFGLLITEKETNNDINTAENERGSVKQQNTTSMLQKSKCSRTK